MNPPSPPAERSRLFSNDLARLLFLCALVGAGAGLGAIAFYWCLEAVHHFTVEQLAGYHPTTPGGEARLFPEAHVPFNPWILFLLPPLGAFVSGILVDKLAPNAAGGGTEVAIDSYHKMAGPIPVRVPFIKMIASSLVIGTGGSGGREGPIAQVGSGFGSILASWLKLSPSERRTLMAAGMAAGIGSIFHAPLAGAIFAAEILYRGMDFEHEVLVPAFIASIVSYTVFCTKFGWNPVFLTPDFVFHEPAQLLPYAVLAVVVALGAILFIKMYAWTHDVFGRLRMPKYLKPTLGAFGVGCFAFFLPEAMGSGYGVIQDSLHGLLSPYLLLAVALGKMVTCSLSIATGGSGGKFGPSVVVGGALGGAVGALAVRWLPAMNIDAGAFVVVGMAGFFSAAANVPISTIIMVSEMTGNYHLLVPSMLVCILAYLISRGHTLYPEQLESRLEAPSKMGNMLSAVLRKLTVRQSLEIDAHPVDYPLESSGPLTSHGTTSSAGSPSGMGTPSTGSPGSLSGSPRPSASASPMGPIRPSSPMGPGSGATSPAPLGPLGPVGHFKAGGSPGTDGSSEPFRPTRELVNVPESMSLSVMIRLLADADQTTFPVVNPEGKLIGVVDWEDVRRVLADEDTIADLIVARDMARVPVTLNLDDNLLTAIRKMNRAETTELIVVDKDNPDRAIATLSHNCVMRAYDEALLSTQPQQFPLF